MREIKFRAWDPRDKRMLYGVEKTYDTLDRYKTASGEKVDQADTAFWAMSSFGHILEKNPELLMQFTGLQDKNGKEIYEGDILRSYIYNQEAPFVCEFVDGGFRFRFNTTMHEQPSKYLEVIGNVNEDPELLK